MITSDVVAQIDPIYIHSTITSIQRTSNHPPFHKVPYLTMSLRTTTTTTITSAILPSTRAIFRKSWTTLPRRHRYSTQSPPTRDPDHPHLYYHPVTSNKLALSFLPHTPIPSSQTIIGFLPMSSDAKLSDFKENKSFL
jgi:hypothetical protein